MPSRVSVVIVNYRAYDELARSLASLGTHDADGLDVCVVDQAGERGELARLKADFPHVTFIASPENRGFAWGVNLGASQSRHEWVLILNPDCEFGPAGIERLASFLEAHPGLGAVGPRIRDRNGSVQASARRFPDITTALAGRSSWLTRRFPSNRFSVRNLPIPDDLSEPIEVDWVSGACVMIRRRAFDELGGMDPGFFLYWEDADFGRRLKSAGWLTVYHPGVEAVHTVGASSTFAPVRSAIAFHQSAWRYYWKHAGRVGRLTAPLVAAGLGLRLALLLSWNYSLLFARAALGLRSLERHDHVS